MKLKNYEWNGFGFPIIFEELPAIKVRGELVPDVEWNEIAGIIVELICLDEDSPLIGNQVKFIRSHLNMSLREFAKFMGVTHVSVMRWEETGKKSAKIGRHIEIVMKIKVLKHIHSALENINKAVQMVETVDKAQSVISKTPKPLKVSETAIQMHF